MALDRQDIEKRDFPIGRRGYEPDAVDAHLRAIAAEVDALKQQQEQLRQAEPPPRPETLATVASEQVRAIVEAAETSAAGIQRDAEDEARRIRQEAADNADRERADAAAQAREHIARVSEATAVMLQRVDAMESELGALVESLRTGANRLTADLALLQGNMGELQAASSGGAAAATAPVDFDEPAPAPSEAEPIPEEPIGLAPESGLAGAPEPAVAEPEPLGADPDQVTVESEAVSVEPEPDLGAPAQPAEAEPFVSQAEPIASEPDAVTEVPEPAGAPAGADDDSEGARLIALNMALNGTPREETDRYLAENFNLSDRDTLLDEVYARVG